MQSLGRIYDSQIDFPASPSGCTDGDNGQVTGKLGVEVVTSRCRGLIVQFADNSPSGQLRLNLSVADNPQSGAGSVRFRDNSSRNRTMQPFPVIAKLLSAASIWSSKRPVGRIGALSP